MFSLTRFLPISALFVGLSFVPLPDIHAQETSQIIDLVERLRNDPRGPYRDIRWFCADGEIREPRDPCPVESPDNHQHARYKPEIERLGEREHLFFGQILTNTDRSAFWDSPNDHSRLKQYLLGKYLGNIDDGWIQQKSQFYRGALQVEDEQAWGRDFLAWLMRNTNVADRDFYLLREAVKDIPHREDTDLSQRIRNVSRVLSDNYPAFMEIRIKIHGQPDYSDAERVRNFLNEHRTELEKKDLVTSMNELITDIEQAYSPSNNLGTIEALLSRLRESSPLKPLIDTFIIQQSNSGAIDRLTAASDLMLVIRRGLAGESYREDRLQLMDIGVELERLIFRTAAQWEPEHPRELMEKICYLSQAAAGAGFIENWEFDQLALQLADHNFPAMARPEVAQYVDAARRAVEWGTATNRATFQGIVDRYAEFEPLAHGFIDDRVRGSVLLPLGEAVSLLADWQASGTDFKNQVPNGMPNANRLRGVNPGYALGTLYVIEGDGEELEVDPKGIYVFARPPADLKPVAGIVTVSEGNLVSHVQLLARNLGIPNMVITEDQFAAFKDFTGEEFFYAVSPVGSVVLRPAAEMTEAEQALFTETERSDARITVDVNRLDLANKAILNMRYVDSQDSGVRCGPKAANLGQLKALFPEQVVEGLVIPFGIFRDHLDQEMPGQSGQTYWDFLNERFAEARRREAAGEEAATIDAYLMEELATLRSAIENIRLRPELIQGIRDSFRQVFGAPLGAVPVFLRSDTNMEDLAEFTGAGLNLTLFNVVEEAAILEGIKRIWASPYTERSYLWRQRYLNNPENVFPSILIIPSVDVDCSGVVITKGILNGDPTATTVAFSRGAGGAVEGQAAETHLLDRWGRPSLLSPARERIHRRLPASGGSEMVPNSFDEPILSRQNLLDLHQLSEEVRQVMAEVPGVESTGPWDIELGFKEDNIWLFQIRPFVENRRALSSDYLESISPQLDNAAEYLDLMYPLFPSK